MKIEDLPVYAQRTMLQYFLKDPGKGENDMTFFPVHHPQVIIPPYMTTTIAMNAMIETDRDKPITTLLYSFSEPDPRVRQTYDPPRPLAPSLVKEWLEIKRGHIRGNPVAGIRLTNEGRRRLYHLVDLADSGALA